MCALSFLRSLVLQECMWASTRSWSAPTRENLRQMGRQKERIACFSVTNTSFLAYIFCKLHCITSDDTEILWMKVTKEEGYPLWWWFHHNMFSSGFWERNKNFYDDHVHVHVWLQDDVYLFALLSNLCAPIKTRFRYKFGSMTDD